MHAAAWVTIGTIIFLFLPGSPAYKRKSDWSTPFPYVGLIQTVAVGVLLWDVLT